MTERSSDPFRFQREHVLKCIGGMVRVQEEELAEHEEFYYRHISKAREKQFLPLLPDSPKTRKILHQFVRSLIQRRSKWFDRNFKNEIAPLTAIYIRYMPLIFFFQTLAYPWDWIQIANSPKFKSFFHEVANKMMELYPERFIHPFPFWDKEKLLAEYDASRGIYVALGGDAGFKHQLLRYNIFVNYRVDLEDLPSMNMEDTNLRVLINFLSKERAIDLLKKKPEFRSWMTYWRYTTVDLLKEIYGEHIEPDSLYWFLFSKVASCDEIIDCVLSGQLSSVFLLERNDFTEKHIQKLLGVPVIADFIQSEGIVFNGRIDFDFFYAHRSLFGEDSEVVLTNVTSEKYYQFINPANPDFTAETLHLELTEIPHNLFSEDHVHYDIMSFAQDKLICSDEIFLERIADYDSAMMNTAILKSYPLTASLIESILATQPKHLEFWSWGSIIDNVLRNFPKYTRAKNVYLREMFEFWHSKTMKDDFEEVKKLFKSLDV